MTEKELLKQWFDREFSDEEVDDIMLHTQRLALFLWRNSLPGWRTAVHLAPRERALRALFAACCDLFAR